MYTGDYYLVRVLYCYDDQVVKRCLVEVIIPTDYIDNSAAVALGVACQEIDDLTRKVEEWRTEHARVIAACIEE